MDQVVVPQNKSIRQDGRTEDLPAQERLTFNAQDATLLSAEQVYAQRLNETRPDGDLSTPTFIP